VKAAGYAHELAGRRFIRRAAAEIHGSVERVRAAAEAAGVVL
jgi:hypothetical protein